MSRPSTGWLLVAIQLALLVALVLLPARDDWPTPQWLIAVTFVFTLSGFAVIAIAARRLGPALTATPLTAQRAVLSTSGPYRFVRHPIYSGLLLIVAGVTARSGSWLVLATAATVVVFLDVKARWEERQLVDRYPDYAAYAAVTPRFVPTLRIGHGRGHR